MICGERIKKYLVRDGKPYYYVDTNNGKWATTIQAKD